MHNPPHELNEKTGKRTSHENSRISSQRFAEEIQRAGAPGRRGHDLPGSPPGGGRIGRRPVCGQGPDPRRGPGQGRGHQGRRHLRRSGEDGRPDPGHDPGTPQTGPEGKVVNKVLVEQAQDIAQELYLGMVVDRGSGKPVIMMSAEGGMEIEEVAARTPEKIFKEAIDAAAGFSPYQARNLAFGIGLNPTLIRPATSFIENLYRMFTSLDCSLAEINPLVVTKGGAMLALDAKLNLDDNAMFRHHNLAAMEDPDEMDPLEHEARKHHLNYIRLTGNVGAMVNGAGLAMATMDLIKAAGADPANFLDVGGGATAEMVANGFPITFGDPNVKGVLINIFGGILRCDVLAQGVVDAVKTVNVNVPIVIRMEGTNVEKGREILRASGLDFTVADGMGDAAKKVVAALSR